KTVTGGRFHRHTEDGKGGIRREGTNRDGACRLESIVLKNEDRSWLSGVGLAASSRPYFAAFHASVSSGGHSEIALTKAWSAAADGLRATAIDCRRASRANSGELIFGIQICTGRKPAFRNLARCARTFSADDFRGRRVVAGRRADFVRRITVGNLLTGMVTCNLSRTGSRDQLSGLWKEDQR